MSDLVSGNLQPEEAQYEAGLRPRRLADFTGQSKLKENLSIAIEAAKKRGEALDHVLLYGPPGLGKTTLAAIIAEELQVSFTTTSAPVLQKKLDLTGILSNIRLHQVFFIDEIHRLAAHLCSFDGDGEILFQLALPGEIGQPARTKPDLILCFFGLEAA